MSVILTAYDHYLLAGLAVSGSFLAAGFLLWLTRRSRYATAIAAFRGVAPNFLSVIGVLFALNLVFLANDTWHAQDRALDAVSQEVGSLRSILALAEDLPEPARSNVERSVGKYLDLTVASEWRLLAHRRSSRAASDELDSLLRLLSSDEVAAVAKKSAHALMLQQAIQIRSMRDVRIALSQTHVNPLKWMGMAFLGFLTMVSIAMVHVEKARAELLAVLLFATAAAPTAAIVLVQGNPFQHPTAVSADPFSALLATLPASSRDQAPAQ
jgi:uncharacterized protein YbaA (DUF1428 family)